MPFNIDSTGTGGFHRSRRGLTQGDVYDTMSIAGHITERVTGSGAPGSVTAEAVEHAMTAYGNVAAMHQLVQSVELLMAGAGAGSEMTIALHGPGFPGGTHAARRISIDPGINDSPVVIRAILGVLDEADLNNWGVLIGIAGMISEYGMASGIANPGRRILLIRVDASSGWELPAAVDIREWL